MKMIVFIAFLAAVFFLVGCAHVPVRCEYNKQIVGEVTDYCLV